MTIKVKIDSEPNGTLHQQSSTGDRTAPKIKAVAKAEKNRVPAKVSKSFKEQIAEGQERVLGRRRESAPSLKEKVSVPTAPTVDSLTRELPDYIKEIGFTTADFSMPSREEVSLRIKKAVDALSTEDREIANGKYKPVFLTSQPRGGGPLPKPKKV